MMLFTGLIPLLSVFVAGVVAADVEGLYGPKGQPDSADFLNYKNDKTGAWQMALLFGITQVNGLLIKNTISTVDSNNLNFAFHKLSSTPSTPQTLIQTMNIPDLPAGMENNRPLWMYAYAEAIPKKWAEEGVFNNTGEDDGGRYTSTVLHMITGLGTDMYHPQTEDELWTLLQKYKKQPVYIQSKANAALGNDIPFPIVSLEGEGEQRMVTVYRANEFGNVFMTLKQALEQVKHVVTISPDKDLSQA